MLSPRNTLPPSFDRSQAGGPCGCQSCVRLGTSFLPQAGQDLQYERSDQCHGLPRSQPQKRSLREFYERADGQPIGLEDLPDLLLVLELNHASPMRFTRWAFPIPWTTSADGGYSHDNEATKKKTWENKGVVQVLGVPFLLQRFRALMVFDDSLRCGKPKTPKQDPWSEKMRRHYGGFCAKCKKGISCSIKRKPASIDRTTLTASDLEKIDKLWSTDPNESSSYFRKLGFYDKENNKLTPIPDSLKKAADLDELENLDRCPFSRAGLCWYSSKDHIGTNRPSPAETLNGWKTPARPNLGYHPVSGGRVAPFTSNTKFDAIELNSMERFFVPAQKCSSWEENRGGMHQLGLGLSPSRSGYRLKPSSGWHNLRA